MAKTINEFDLAQFTGSGNWYRHITGMLFTDGVKYLADKAGAYWLIDECLFAQRLYKVRGEEFQVWKLSVNSSTALLTCEDGNGNAVYVKRITYTDFPLPKIVLWFSGNTLLLPSEY